MMGHIMTIKGLVHISNRCTVFNFFTLLLVYFWVGGTNYLWLSNSKWVKICICCPRKLNFLQIILWNYFCFWPPTFTSQLCNHLALGLYLIFHSESNIARKLLTSYGDWHGSSISTGSFHLALNLTWPYT